MNNFEAIKDGYFGDPKNWKYVSQTIGDQTERLALRPTIVSVKSGRWYDPGTWDKNRCPSKDDVVEVRHVVEVGKTAVVYFKQLQNRSGGCLYQVQTGTVGQKYINVVGSICAIGSPAVVVK